MEKLTKKEVLELIADLACENFQHGEMSENLTFSKKEIEKQRNRCRELLK